MTKMFRAFLIAILAAGTAFAGSGVALAQDVDCGECTNQQDGDNEAESTQAGSSNSGDAVGGQVVGVVSAGDASVDAKNRSEDVDIETGEAHAGNDAATFVGLSFTGDDIEVETEEAEADEVTNQQSGDNEYSFDQSADATTGDGVGGQVIGVVTSAGGSADVVADNASKDIEIETGLAEAFNDSAAFVGLNVATDTDVTTEDDVDADEATNQQDGDNALSGSQDVSANTGDGVGGQVLGIVSAGDASVDAKNRSEDVEITTGDASAANQSAAFIGLNFTEDDIEVETEDAEADEVTNQQAGDNEGTVAQTADASSGDAVAGQVAGVVTSAGGSADLVLDNASKDVELESGFSEFDNLDQLFVGLNVSSETDIG